MQPAVGFDEYHYSKKTSLTESKAVFFAVKIGGPISCGTHQGLIEGFNNHAKLSCENRQIEDELTNFNAKNSKERFLILFSLTPKILAGETIEAFNYSAIGLEYGKKYLVFLNQKKGKSFFDQCTFIEESLYQPLFADPIANLDRQTVEKFVAANNKRCMYE